MAKPAVIDTPFPTLAELGRIYGLSATRQKQIVRSVERLLVSHGARRRSSARSGARRQAPARRSRKR